MDKHTENDDLIIDELIASIPYKDSDGEIDEESLRNQLQQALTECGQILAQIERVYEKKVSYYSIPCLCDPEAICMCSEQKKTEYIPVRLQALTKE